MKYLETFIHLAATATLTLLVLCLIEAAQRAVAYEQAYEAMRAEYESLARSAGRPSNSAFKCVARPSQHIHIAE